MIFIFARTFIKNRNPEIKICHWSCSPSILISGILLNLPPYSCYRPIVLCWPVYVLILLFYFGLYNLRTDLFFLFFFVSTYSVLFSFIFVFISPFSCFECLLAFILCYFVSFNFIWSYPFIIICWVINSIEQCFGSPCGVLNVLYEQRWLDFFQIFFIHWSSMPFFKFF